MSYYFLKTKPSEESILKTKLTIVISSQPSQTKTVSQWVKIGSNPLVKTEMTYVK